MLSPIGREDEASYRDRMNEMTQRLLEEFSALPVRMVLGAVDTIRRSLRDDESNAEPDDVAVLARWMLSSERVLAAAGMA